MIKIRIMKFKNQLFFKILTVAKYFGCSIQATTMIDKIYFRKYTKLKNLMS